MNSDKINVLLIDDHELILHGIEHILEQIPAVGTVRTARSGQEALELIGRTPFDLSILDIELPDLSGFDLIGHTSAPAIRRHASSSIPCTRRYGTSTG
ncbi:MAG: response regulator transcription factor [Alistipes sp.]|uniref:response regulator transcription factor n=1 Tax=Alistipes sp. TaxID=1872444 RepID=UPI00399259B5